MDSLTTCSDCAGFLPSTAAACPHCEARQARSRRRRLAVLFGLAGSASLGLTLMACYGCPPDSNGCLDFSNPNTDANADTTGSDGGAD
jgi:hypothetical protein